LVNGQENTFVAASTEVFKPGGGVLALRLKLVSNAQQDYCHLRDVLVLAWEPYVARW
jgi:hypothetical protein